MSPDGGRWIVGFERDSNGFRSSFQTKLRTSPGGELAIDLPEYSTRAVGISVAPGRYDLSGYEEIHLWVQADAAVTVQPFSQSSGWAFRDGGGPDVILPGDGSVVMLRIPRESMVDPTMVQAIGIQTRPGSGAGAKVRVLAVTAVPRILVPRPATLAITNPTIPGTGNLYSPVVVDFNLSRLYDNPYDPDQIDVQGHFTTPSGKEIALPAFWFQDYQARTVNQNWEEYDPVGDPHWRIRYLPMESGQHTLRISAHDNAGYSEEAGPYSFTVAAGTAHGPVRRSPTNPLSLQYANGVPYVPIGHNLGFEDGNPDLNGTRYYKSLLPVFASAGENWTRFWMTDFSRTTLEWSAGHWSGFYQGVGVYSQRAAWRVDQFFETALANGIQIQLVIIDHGQVSTATDARWNGSGGTNTGNPYNSAFGGPVPQTNPELFFSNADARALFHRRLRYLAARWAAYPNLLAWELFNEVQWAGSSQMNMRSSSETRNAIIDWHREMADALKTLDPFGHLVTTSSDDPPSGTPGFDLIWRLASMDTIQSHHYIGPPSYRDFYIRQYVAAAQKTYGKPVIVGEMGVKANSAPECNFNPQNFLTDTNVPSSERTPANRDHMIAGTTLRNGIWSAALTQSGAMNWWWGCYMADDQRQNRLPPDFPLHARLFPPLVSFLGGEDSSSSPLSTATLQTTGQILAYGLQAPSGALVWARDTRNAYGTGYGPAATEARATNGATVTLSGLDPGSYVLSLYDTYGNGDLISQSEVTASGSILDVDLPSFLGDVAFKLGSGTADTWGAVPRSSKSWITDGNPPGGPVYYAAMHSSAEFADAVAGGVLTYSDSDSPLWELTGPAAGSSKSYWTVAEIGAPSETGLALVNVGSAPASVALAVYDEKGKPKAWVPLTLAPGEHVSKFLVEWFGQALAPFRGALEVRSDQPLVALALRGASNDLGQFIMTSIPARGDEIPVPDQPGALPQVADGGGYQTEWLLLNPTDAALTGKVRFRKSDGSVWMLTIQGTALSEIPYNISAHGLVRWTTAGTAPDTSTGYCVLVPDAGQPTPAGGAVIRYLPGNRLLSETGIPFTALADGAGSFWEVSPDLDTGVAFINNGGSDLSINLQLFLRDGSEQVRQTEVKLPAGQHTARFVSQIFPGLPASGRGYLRATSNRPFGFLPLRMRTTIRGVLFSSLLLGPLAGGVDRVLPQVVHGSGYHTQFILVNRGDLASSGKISFYDTEGKPARLLLRKP